MKSTKFWVTLTIIMLIVSMAAAVAVFLFYGSGNTAVIYHKGELVDKIHLTTVTTPYTFTINSENGHYNTIQVEQGRICVIDASCPDHVCIQTGWISDGVIPIVCLPNELVIQIESNSDKSVDAAAQ